MRELVLFITTTLYVDKDTKVVRPRSHSYAGSGKLGTQLIKATSRNAFHRAIDEESGYRGMMGSLFCNVRDSDWFVLSVNMFGNRLFRRFPKDWLDGVFHFPVTLMSRSIETYRGY